MSKIPKSRMKLTDYLRLGRLSIKARKKSTKNTVFGMSFGLILLVPMIFFAVAFYTDLSQQVNSIKTASALTIELKNVNDKAASTPYKPYTTGTDGQQGMPAFADYYDLIDMPEVEDYILSEYCDMGFMYSEDLMKLSLDGVNHNLGSFQGYQNQGSSRQPHGLNKLKIIYTEESTSNMFTEAELFDYKTMTGKNNPFLSVCNSGFTASTKGKNEVIVSEALLKLWGIDKDDIAYKKISILYPKFQMGNQLGWIQIDNDTITTNEVVYPQHDDPEHQLYLMYEFEVVGIIKSDYYEMPGKLGESHLWVTAASVYYKEGRQEYKPIEYTLTTTNNYGNYLTFKNNITTVKELNIDDQYMLLVQSMANRYREVYSNTGSSTFELNYMSLTLQIAEYNMLGTVIPNVKIMLKDAYNDVPANQFSGIIANEVYTSFYIIDQLGKILIIVFSAIGGIIFFTNMLNLLNTVRYSVESRKNYIGVMRAIGAKSRVIPRLYIFEMLIIFLKTFIRVAIFSSVISYGIKYGLDKAFVYVATIVSFEVNFIYYPVALGAAFAVTLFIGIFFARVSSKFTAYQPILKTLYDEK